MEIRKLSKQEARIIGLFILFNLLLHFISTLFFAYGYFRDELYYLACSEHLALGYVDHPPLSIYLLSFVRFIFGDSLFAVRLLPAILSSATIGLTGLMTKEMGGKVFAVFLASLSVFISGIHTVFGGFYSMNVIDIFIWALSFYLIIQLVKIERPSLWWWLGIVLGLGLLNKISVLFLGVGLAGGLLLTKERKWLVTHWPYTAGSIALILFMPYIIWNFMHDFAHLEFIHNAGSLKYSKRNYGDFLQEQILFISPLNLLVWLTGLIALFCYQPLKPFKIVGWIYLISFSILLINKTSKGEYLSPAYSVLFASGGIFFENFLIKRKWQWLKVIYASLMLGSFLLLLPFAVPLLPVEKFISYSRSIGISPSSSENKALSELPQFYADMFGWKEKAQDVAKVFNTLTPEEKKACVIFSNNYGRCGALDFFGNAYGLPNSIGNHNNYWIWGPGEKSGNTMIILGGELEDHLDNFNSVIEAGVSSCRYSMPYENHVKIFLCKGIKTPLKKIWPQEKHYE